MDLYGSRHLEMADTALGVRHSPVARMITKTVVLANVISIFGKDLGQPSPFSRCKQSTYVINQ